MTEGLMKILKAKQEDLKSQWANGNFTDQSQYATAIKNAEAVGICGICEEISSLDYETLIGELEDNGKH